MKEIPKKMLKLLFENVTALSIGSSHKERLWFKVVKGTSKDKQREIASIVQQYYTGWYKDYGSVGTDTDLYVAFDNEEHCRLAFEDLCAQRTRYMESDDYTGVSAGSSDSIDYSDAEGAEPEDDDDETPAQSPLASLLQNKSLLIVGAVLVAAVTMVLVFAKD